MTGVSLAPMAGAQGDFAGVSMIRAYHEANGDHQRREIIVPSAAHGTNPATAVMCGYEVTEIAVGPDGDVDLEELKSKVGPQTAGLMMTNPSTCGVFERQISEIASTVPSRRLTYYDGANLNTYLEKSNPEPWVSMLHEFTDNLPPTAERMALVPLEFEETFACRYQS